ncbi:MAG: 50S ribosomal protein L35 [Planctomycetes bacterium]|nr:50S ribosomal protein L35 [Planctomycetota bacterium]
MKRKEKTHKGMKKRFKLTRKGKVVTQRPGKGHLMSGKSGRRKRKLSRRHTLEGIIAVKAARLLGG